MAAGVLPLSGLQLGVESVAGTAVTTTRELYPSLAGSFNPGVMVSHHEGAQRGTFANITHGTVIGYGPTISFQSEPSHGLTYDELPIIISQLNAGETGANTTADKDWSVTAGGATHTFDTYTLNAFDGTQAYEIDYGFMTRFTISAGFDDLTQWSADWVGRQTAKVTVDSVAANNAVKMPSGLWTIKYATSQSGLTGASALGTTMRSFTLTVDLPQRPRRYAGGTLEFGRGVASGNLAGQLQMVWDSESDAVTQYDRMVSQSVSFFRLAHTGPVIGSGTYAAQIDVACLAPTDGIVPLGSESDGVMEYGLTFDLVYDATFTAAIGIDATASIAALP